MTNALVNLADEEEIARYEKALRDHLAGRMDAERFAAVRLQHGIYGQRQEQAYMVRIKVPGGALTPQRLRVIGEVQQHYARAPFASVTTRQDIQLHFVALEDTPAVMRVLATAGLTTREACGNTVRNVTACALAGVCPREHTDVRTALNATVTHFLRHPLTQHLPRKFKISFSGCESDCAQGMLHDLAVVAVRDGERFGFRVLAGGGLGHKPREAQIIEPFLPAQWLLPCLEAVIGVHHRYSDRTKRARSRIKFLFDRFGFEGFMARYREEFARTRAAAGEFPPLTPQWREAGGEGPDGPGAPRRPLPQRQAGLVAMPVALPVGDITAVQLQGLAACMTRSGLAQARTTQDQNLVLLDVPAGQVPPLQAELAALGLAGPEPGDDVVACPGTWTCRLGITASRDVAPALNTAAQDLRVRVSGCHNGCAQPYVGDIGLHGEGRRLHGRLVPHYRLHLGGDGRAGGSLAVVGPEVPTMRAPQAVQRIAAAYRDSGADASFATWARRQGAEYFNTLLADLTQVAPETLDQVCRDHGGEGEFRVLALGGGECAGVAEETVSAMLAEVTYERSYRDTFIRQRMYREAAESAATMLRRAGQAATTADGRRAADDVSAIAAALSDSGASAGAQLAEALSALAERLAVAGEEPPADAFARLVNEVDSWCARAEALARGEGPVPSRPIAATELDLSQDDCPMHYIKARMALGKMGPGEALNLRLADAEASGLVGRSLASLGYHIQSTDAADDGTHVMRVCIPVERDTGPRPVPNPEEMS